MTPAPILTASELAQHNAGRTAYHTRKPFDPDQSPHWQQGWSAAAQEHAKDIPLITARS